ncbi:TPA: hypothetical protein DIC38_03030 [Candidatus Nomurabacteria bacterium]|nr:MAG: hypothetical protein O210_OD1C00001G0178 [Parcubacteria bacterium RAAC4_OD1_1]HCY26626.1 hypothetical protein [Candidatus Nomurabacteria bacterium]
MNINKKTIISVFVVVLLVLGLIYFIKRGENLQTNNLNNTKNQLLEEFIFTFKEELTDKELTVKVSRDGKILTLNYGNIIEEKLTLSLSTNGSKYTNYNESIVFWNKGNEAIVYQNDAIIFQGTIIE